MLAVANRLIVLVDTAVALASVRASSNGGAAAIAGAGHALLQEWAAEGAKSCALIRVTALAAPPNSLLELAVFRRCLEWAIGVGLLFIRVRQGVGSSNG